MHIKAKICGKPDKAVAEFVPNSSHFPYKVKSLGGTLPLCYKEKEFVKSTTSLDGTYPAKEEPFPHIWKADGSCKSA